MSLKKIFLGLGAIFVFMIFISFKYAEYKERGFSDTIILKDANSILDKDITFRKWVAMHGGVYVPITEKTPPNPYLKVPNRDITSTSGMELTLMNPAYALRQFMNDFEGSYGDKGKTTSLKLMNPNNAPDAFEKAVLQEFEKSDKPKEYYEKIKNTQGQMELRYMKPLIVEKSCLKCHAHQGYKIGDARGGISIVLPLENYEKALEIVLNYLKSIHMFALFSGMVFLYLLYLYLKKAEIKKTLLQQQINDEKERFRLAIEGSNDGLWDWNPQTNEIYFSPRWKDILGYKDNEMVSNFDEWVSRVHPDDIDQAFADIKAHIDGKTEVYENEHRLKHKDGHWLWTLARGKALIDENGDAQKFVGFNIDITQRKYQEEILQQKIKEALEQNTKQLEILQQQNKMASMGEMIGAIAHQWRQPLNEIGISIQNTKYDFRNGEIDEKYIKEFIDENRKVIEFMSKTIDDFRGFFRVDKEKKDFNVKEAIEKVVNMQSAQLKDHQISLDISGDDFDIVNLESEFQQVILNIISNAKDALIENKIQNPKIEIVLKDNSVYIKDNGGGIPKDIIERIFEPYYTTKEQGKGTGMGLYMSKMIIEDNMGGGLYVENVDDGAVFIIDLNEENKKGLLI